jgi:hypothetical protein
MWDIWGAKWLVYQVDSLPTSPHEFKIYIYASSGIRTHDLTARGEEYYIDRVATETHFPGSSSRTS